MSQLQAKLNELMLNKKMNAVDIERATGISKNTVYSILTGKAASPSVHNLQLIAKALDVSIESLLIDKHEFRANSLNVEQMKAFSEATAATINMLLEKHLNFPLDELIKLIKEVYQYSIKVNPPCVDERFIEWIIDKHNH